MNNKVREISRGEFRGASGKAGGADTFYKSAAGALANSTLGNGGFMNAAGDTATTDPTATATSAATPATTSTCTCAAWHKPGCFVGGLLIGALVTYIIVSKKSA